MGDGKYIYILLNKHTHTNIYHGRFMQFVAESFFILIIIYLVKASFGKQITMFLLSLLKNLKRLSKGRSKRQMILVKIDFTKST